MWAIDMYHVIYGIIFEQQIQIHTQGHVIINGNNYRQLEGLFPVAILQNGNLIEKTFNFTFDNYNHIGDGHSRQVHTLLSQYTYIIDNV